ncbi:PglL family O-oligosaccharyltransferase [Vibrio gangliei]|uniref:PglL family O-oligosaccharyltransferase n=1 Tax=Vibrio gangliei TaxID=2077090 RepID=UPI000D01450A|nr:PglL family O-oligosaccharyltransferase [Vibrio gangliei]
MAILHTQGTELEKVPEPNILAKPFLWALGVVFLLAMHYFQPNPGGAGLALSFNSTTWLAISVVIGIGLYATANMRKLRLTSLTIVMLVACIILTIPVFYSASQGSDALLRLIGLWGGWLLLLLLHQYPLSNKQKQTLLMLIVGAVCTEAAYGYFQYLFLEAGNSFGYNTENNRPFAIFQQPNVMASFLATGLAVGSYLLARQKQTHVSHHKALSILLLLMPTITIPLLWVLASRTGWLGATVATVLLIPYLHKFLPKRVMTLWLISVIVGLAGGYTLASANGGNELIAQKSNLESPRRYTFPQTFDMVIEKPWTGYGYGRFEPAYMLYTARQHQLNEDYHPGLPSMDHPHNEILYWAVEGGIVPILGLLLAALEVFRKVRKAQHGTRLALVALFFPIVLHTQLEYPFYHSAIHWIIFIILIYWVDQLTSQYQEVNFSKITKSLMSVFSLVIPIITAFFMLTALHTNAVLSKFEYTRPLNPDLLNQVTNPSVWKDRFDWDVYHTQLNIGLHLGNPEYIQPYIDWANKIIKRKPRAAFYSSLIVAYQGIGDNHKAEQIRKEAEFLFPAQDFSKIRYISPEERASKAKAMSGAKEAKE